MPALLLFPVPPPERPEELVRRLHTFQQTDPDKASFCWDLKIPQSKVHTSEVDLELQLMVINFLSLVALTSTIYLQDGINEILHCKSIKKTNKQTKNKTKHFI